MIFMHRNCDLAKADQTCSSLISCDHHSWLVFFDLAIQTGISFCG